MDERRAIIIERDEEMAEITTRLEMESMPLQTGTLFSALDRHPMALLFSSATA